MSMVMDLAQPQTASHPDEPVIEGSVTVENCVVHARTWKHVRAACIRRTGKDCGYPFCRCLPMAEAA